METTWRIFDSRLATFNSLLELARSHFDDESFLEFRLIADMLPLGTQIVFTCNQPRNFVQWVTGEKTSNLDPEVHDVSTAIEIIAQTRAQLAAVTPHQVSLPEHKRLELGPTRYADLSGEEYLNDFLIPNFYFHLVTSYDILRTNGVMVGKENYMAHLLGKVRETE